MLVTSHSYCRYPAATQLPSPLWQHHYRRTAAPLTALSGGGRLPGGPGGAARARLALVAGDGGALGDVPVCGGLVEAAAAVRTLDVVGGVQRRRRRQVLQLPAVSQVLLGLLRSADVADELLVLLTPVLFGRLRRLWMARKDYWGRECMEILRQLPANLLCI